MKNALFIIESGRPLEMVKAYIADTIRIRDENYALAKELGVENIYTHNATGELLGVVFDGDIHAQFGKPKKRNGPSYPKAGTEWFKRFKALKGTVDASELLSREFAIPRSLSYTSAGGGGGEGWRHIGNMLNECGFMFLSKDGPYGMWAPDVPAFVKKMAEEGEVVTGQAATFEFAIPGTRRILSEEWDFIVAQHRLAEKQRELAAEAAETA
jgi:hypothetical protein